MDDIELADRCAAAGSEVVALAGSGAPWRRTDVVRGVQVAVLGNFSDPWAAQGLLTAGWPGDDAVAEVMAWLRRHGPGPFMVTIRDEDSADPRWEAVGLVPWSAEPVFADESTAAVTWPMHALEPQVRVPRDAEEFIGAYNSWVEHEIAVRQLVVDDDLSDPSKRFLVIDVEGAAVGSAIVRYAGGTGYVSGIGVHPDYRRRGYGAALTLAAARLAARGTDVVWLHASEEGSQLYRRLGFRCVDTHIALIPAARRA
ncbi:MAG: GNAT family N-acetyltransferase [Actinomycetes bacterium]